MQLVTHTGIPGTGILWADIRETNVLTEWKAGRDPDHMDSQYLVFFQKRGRGWCFPPIPSFNFQLFYQEGFPLSKTRVQSVLSPLNSSVSLTFKANRP